MYNVCSPLQKCPCFGIDTREIKIKTWRLSCDKAIQLRRTVHFNFRLLTVKMYAPQFALKFDSTNNAIDVS